ncbi:hypothetical protein K438DRAFT_1840159 [Mycena galopus ATCC 62051]|nr:hypothetical protein K438DRAFT_1840159 [Mycena galopus ATCC 62051]
MAHLARHGITETDIKACSFNTTSDAVSALRVARFITRIDALRLRFKRSHGSKFDRDVAELVLLARRSPIRSIDLEFSPRNPTTERRGIIEDLTLDLISPYRSRPAIIVSPLAVSIARPRKPARSLVRRFFARLRRKAKHKIDEERFREAFLIFSLLLQGLGGGIPRVSIRTFDAPNPMGSLIVLYAPRISDLRFPASLRLSASEMNALLTELNFPLLRNINVTSCPIPEPALHSFLCRHPTLQGLRLAGCRLTNEQSPGSAPQSLQLLAPHALPRLEHVLGSARLVAWVLASPQEFPHLLVATIELYGTGPQNDYRTALRGLARRSTADTLALQISGWAPWDASDFAAPTVPERTLPHVTDLRLTFRVPARAPKATVLAQWLRLFTGLQKVSVFDALHLEARCVLLREELPHVTFMAYVLEKQ